jgi:metal-responsive CopG/Arc/MetJ family transcriptional regulator
MSEQLSAALDFIHVRDGISRSEQIRRAIELWVKQKGVRRTRPAGRRRNNVSA